MINIVSLAGNIKFKILLEDITGNTRSNKIF